MPDTTASDQAKAAANTATQGGPGSAHAASGPTSATPAAGGQQQKAPAGLPADLQGKSAEEIFSALSDRYKDYDTIKSRAAEAEAYTKLGIAPDKIQETVKWVTDVVAGLQGGKRAAYDPQRNQIVFLDAEGKPTGQTAQPGEGQPQNPFDDNYAMLDPRQQGEKMSEYVWEARLRPEVNKIVAGFDQRFNTAIAQMQQRDNIFLEVLDRWIQNPKLKPRDIMARVLELQQGAQRGGVNFIDLATKELSSPDEMEAEVQRRVAAALAEEKAKNETNAAAGSILPAPVSWKPRGLGENGQPMNRMERRNGLMNQFREKGLLRPN